jgi:hypothetical protein
VLKHKPLDLITLFHKASSPASVRAAAVLRQASANATASATEDQAADHTAQNDEAKGLESFELDISEDLPNEDQLRTILDYAGEGNAGIVVSGASSVSDALKKYKRDEQSFRRPLVCLPLVQGRWCYRTSGAA